MCTGVFTILFTSISTPENYIYKHIYNYMYSYSHIGKQYLQPYLQACLQLYVGRLLEEIWKDFLEDCAVKSASSFGGFSVCLAFLRAAFRATLARRAPALRAQ